MKNFLTVLLFFLCGTLYSSEYIWDFIDALAKNDFSAVENILKKNINKIPAEEKRLLMNFSLNYCRGENAIKAMDILERYNIRPTGYDLFTAINRNQPDIVIYSIMNRGAQANGEILLLLTEKQRFDVAAQLIEAGIDVNYQYPLSKSYADGMTPLLYACKWNNFELVKILVEHGANIQTKDKNGSTALSIARVNGNNQIVNFLLENGAVESGNYLPPRQGTGVSSFLENQAAFQTGTYYVLGGSISMRFSGNANSGSINYIVNGMSRTGVYKVEGSNLSLAMDGRTFTYKVDSNTSFSGNGEVWVRTGN
ncbi:MAG: ankyrin repeat domain-containing protein [Spirochaetes bacterium]|nr:ankyrin repeat domain-containing protein [Spirochaetota bacterium]